MILMVIELVIVGVGVGVLARLQRRWTFGFLIVWGGICKMKTALGN